MYHIKFKPSGTGPWPKVLMLPPDIFKLEIKANGTTKERVATRDLTDNGFLVFQIEHRLAPDGLLQDQTMHCSGDDCTAAQVASGRPPQQTDDVKQQILAALDDTDCNGKIFLIGGSAGGCLALWVALDPAPGNITDWGPDVVAKIKAVVGLSGVYDLSLRTPQPPQTFIDDVDNYTNTTEQQADCAAKQYAVSPISLVAAATPIPPVRLYATEGDSVPPVQATNMKTALQAQGVDVQEYTMSGSAHAFNYWHMINNQTNPPECVSEQVIDFLNAHKNDP
jgi:acetyl esterase/lipase